MIDTPTRDQPRVLPHSEESERAVLASVLLSPEVLPLGSGRLHAEDFYLDRVPATCILMTCEFAARRPEECPP